MTKNLVRSNALGENIFAEGGPSLFTLVDVEVIEQGLSLRRVKMTWQTNLDSIPPEQARIITGLTVNGFPDDLDRTSVVFRQVERNSEVCISLRIIAMDGTGSRVSTFCADID